MDEYIEREALEVTLNHRLNFLMAENGEYDHYTSGFDEAVTIVENFPAADVAPVRHGRWEEADWVEPDCHGFGIIRTPKAALRCSNCKNCFKKELLWKDNYCPNCGAKMDGDDHA